MEFNFRKTYQSFNIKTFSIFDPMLGNKLSCIVQIVKKLELINSQKLKQTIKRKVLTDNLEWFQNNLSKFVQIFKLNKKILKTRGGKLDVRGCVGLINNILDKWGYSKMAADKQYRIQVDGETKKVSDFKMVSNLPEKILRHKYIYKFIKPKHTKSLTHTEGDTHRKKLTNNLNINKYI